MSTPTVTAQANSTGNELTASGNTIYSGIGNDDVTFVLEFDPSTPILDTPLDMTGVTASGDGFAIENPTPLTFVSKTTTRMEFKGVLKVAKSDSYTLTIALATGTGEAFEGQSPSSFSWTYDNDGGHATVEGVTNDSKQNASKYDLTFTLSEASGDFAEDGIEVTFDGTDAPVLSAFSFDGATSASVTLTPNANLEVMQVISVRVPENTYTGENQNLNSAGNTLTWTHDPVAPTVTSVTISESLTNSTSVDVTNSTSVDVTIVLSEVSTDFTANHIISSHGSVDNFNSTNNPEFTAQINLGDETSAQTGTEVTVTVGNNGTAFFSDEAGNLAGTTKAATFTFDNQKPEVDDFSLATAPNAANKTATLSLTLTEAVTASPNVFVSAGSVVSITEDQDTDTSFTVEINCSAENDGDEITATINAGSMQDAAGNTNSQASSVTFTLISLALRSTSQATSCPMDLEGSSPSGLRGIQRCSSL